MPEDQQQQLQTCRWCGREVERIRSGTWADGKPMLRHVDTLQPRCHTFDDQLAEVAPDA